MATPVAKTTVPVKVTPSKRSQAASQRDLKKSFPKKLGAPPIFMFDLTSDFNGYRSKEDITNLAPGYLVSPSQNVVTLTSGLVASRPGYTLDGQAGLDGTPVLGSFDWTKQGGLSRNMRTTNGKLQVRYVAAAGDKWKTNTFTAGQVFWIDLLTGSASDYWQFCTFYDQNTEKTNFMLGVNQTSNIYEWSGGMATLASATVNTITLNGTATWAQLGFYANGTRSVTINGNVYGYTGGEGTTTLTGVTADASAEPANSVITQTVRTTANSAMTGIPSNFRNDLIAVLNNQIYVASIIDVLVYVSKANIYTDFSFSSPTRKPAEGMKLTLDGTITALAPRDAAMDISCGKDFWFETIFTPSSDLTTEALSVKKLKTAPLQAALNQGLVSNFGNDLAFVSFEPVISTLGWVEEVINTPQVTNIGDPIKTDVDNYGVAGFADGHAIYYKYFLYISVPQKGIVRIYNTAKGWWEAPWTMPIGRFSIINGQLVGHSYLTDESYTLYTGNNDNGNPIHNIAAFSYDNFGGRGTLKRFREYYVEGYISSNTILNLVTKLDFGGFTGAPTYPISGVGPLGIFQTIADGSLGKSPIGENPLGSITDSILNLPKFRVIKTGVPTNFFEYQAYFETNDIDQNWAILAYGPRLEAGDEPNYVKQ